MIRLPDRSLLLFAWVGLLAVSGCAVDNTPTTPEVQVPDCERLNTAELEFRNTSNTNTTYDIVWDGAKITVLAPGQTSQKYTVAAGVQHTLVFKVTNTNTNACNPSTPTLAQCYSGWLSCSS